MCTRAWGIAGWVEMGWLAAAVAVPLIFNPWGGSSFELPKAALLRALVLLMGLASLVRLIEARAGSGRSPQNWRATPLLWTALVFGLGLTLATAFSVNPSVSLWGSYERQQGLFTFGSYLVLFLLTATGLHTRAQVERLWNALVWASAPVVAYGLLQATGWDPLNWSTDAASPVLSTLGRANFLGSYLVLVAPLTAGRALLARRRWPYLLLLAAQLLALALAQARGAWVGLGVAALIFGLAWAAATHDRRWALAALVMAMLAVSLVGMLNWPQGPLASLARIPGLERMAIQADAGSTAARLTIWRATLPLISARPWLGYGPETMRTVFARVFPPQLVYYQGRHVTVDRAHNLWLDLGMSAGLVGVVAFGTVLVGFGWLAWKGIRSAPHRWEQVAWTALAAAVAGHVTDLQFGFDLTASATFFWLTLAMGAALGRGLSAESGRFSTPLALPSSLILALALAAVGGLLVVSALPLVADLYHWQAEEEEHGLEERIADEMRAVRWQPQVLEYRLGLSWLYLLRSQADAAPVRWLEAAEAQLIAADRLSPADPQVWAAQGEFYAYWGQVDPTKYAEAEAAYARAVDLAPNTATLYTGWGLVYAGQGRYTEAVERFKYAVALDATDGYAYWHLGSAYAMLGRPKAAEEAHCQAFRWAPELRSEQAEQWERCSTLDKP